MSSALSGQTSLFIHSSDSSSSSASTDQSAAIAGKADNNRRHDLDALRAFAMFLGIALHASLSLTGYPWIVTDLYPNPVFGLLYAVIHGFRMPMFMLLSGFFTMMLWRKRGLRQLLQQRFLRVVLPLVIALVTIIPAQDAITAWSVKVAIAQRMNRTESSSSLITAIRTGAVEKVAAELDQGRDVNEPDQEFGAPPLTWSALYGHADVAKLLLDRGADINKTDRGGYRALHSAAFLGRFEVVEVLTARGAEIEARGPQNDTAIDSANTDMGITYFITSAMRLPVIEGEELQSGRARCIELLASRGLKSTKIATNTVRPPSSWLENLRAQYAAFTISPRFLIDQKPIVLHLIQTPVFHHLWFLWFLCWYVAAFAVVVSVGQWLPKFSLPSWLLLSWARFLWLIPVTLLPQLLMNIQVPGFGPDTSAGLMPQPHLLLYYGIFFAVGAVYFDCDDRDCRMGRGWWLLIPLSVVIVMPLGLVFLSQPVVTGVAQVTFAWAMTFGMLGLFHRLLKRESAWIRYLSDSAYWLYLTHLPVLIVLQTWFRDWEFSAFSKFALMCTLTTVALLIVYQLAVRHTIIGWLLNGTVTVRREPVLDSVAVSNAKPVL